MDVEFHQRTENKSYRHDVIINMFDSSHLEKIMKRMQRKLSKDFSDIKLDKLPDTILGPHYALILKVVLKYIPKNKVDVYVFSIGLFRDGWSIRLIDPKHSISIKKAMTGNPNWFRGWTDGTEEVVPLLYAIYDKLENVLKQPLPDF